MNLICRSHIARVLALMALTLQTLLPGTLALAKTDSLNVANFICAPTGNVSSEAKAAVEALLEIVDPDQNDELPQSTENHCSLCTLVDLAALPSPAAMSVPLSRPTVIEPISFRALKAYFAQGPPLGPRAPPSHI